METLTVAPIETIKGLVVAQENFKGGKFTIRSKKTGKDFTYKLKKTEFGDYFYIHCYIETQYMKFKYLGYYKDGKLLKNRMVNSDVTAKGIAWIIQKIFNKDLGAVTEKSEIMHLGKCLKCGRTLTDAKSIEMGFGSVCRSILN